MYKFKPFIKLHESVQKLTTQGKHLSQIGLKCLMNTRSIITYTIHKYIHDMPRVLIKFNNFYKSFGSQLQYR